MHIIITHDYSDRQLVCCGSAVTHPFYIHLDSDGSAFVIDHRNGGYVYHYDMDGNFNTSFLNQEVTLVIQQSKTTIS